MPAKWSVQTVTIASGGTISQDVVALSGNDVAIFCPVVTSCAIQFRACTDTTSALFGPLFVTNGSSTGLLNWNAGPGSCSMNAGEFLGGFPYFRIVTSVAQAAPRNFIVLLKVH